MNPISQYIKLLFVSVLIISISTMGKSTSPLERRGLLRHSNKKWIQTKKRDLQNLQRRAEIDQKNRSKMQKYRTKCAKEKAKTT